MGTATFDTLKLVDALEKAQIPREQARAIVDVVRESRDSDDVATKGDLRNEIALVRKDMDAMEQRSQARFTLLQWMLGILIAGVASLVLKAYF